jgi:hypothetical protein
MTGFPGLPSNADSRQIVAVVNRVNLGKLNCTGTVTLLAGQSITTVTDHRAAAESFVVFMPLSANAAVEQAAGGMYVSGRGTGSFAIAHANNAQVDRTFGYAVIG